VIDVDSAARKTCATMTKGEVVEFKGHRCVVLGMDPLGATPRLVYLYDMDTARREWVPLEDIEARVTPQPLRLLLGGNRAPDE
jgi:hypothetical protein